MNIDPDKIAEIIENSVVSVSNPLNCWTNETVCVGEFEGVQVYIFVTRDESEFMDINEVSENDLAVTQ